MINTLIPIRFVTVGLLLPSAIFLNACYKEATPYKELIARHATIQGKIHSKYCNNHGQTFYDFELEGKVYLGSSGSVGQVACEKLKIGSPVTVYYNPDNPSVHTLLIPQEAYEREHGFDIPIWLFILIFFFGNLARLVRSMWKE